MIKFLYYINHTLKFYRMKYLQEGLLRLNIISLIIR